ncbi:AAA family ATPase [Spongisporangium articulatum]|uniref:AAA family ATPase n=1 Tax=Spongisporangium articulatum TaxID=3362603 RepID=A0ABW8AGI4_9ACTN
MSDRWRHGLVIGKFYPPHAGHHHLVDVAAARCERLTVLVMAATGESVPLARRVDWMRARHPQVSVVGVTDDLEMDLQSDRVWAAHVALMRAALERDCVLQGRPAASAVVDLVASSETYGEELALRFGADHLAVDLDRSTHPVSGTAVRADPVAAWAHLAPPVRTGLARRVAFVGAESTGTTTVSRRVAAALRRWGGVWSSTGWVPEYGRAYTEGRLAVAAALAVAVGEAPPAMDRLTWTPEDFVAVAERQARLEALESASGGPVLVCDTDAFATDVWHRRYLGTYNRDVRAVADRRPADLYLLTDDAGVPFVQDSLRDGEHLRAWMTREFAEQLEASGRPWHLLSGPEDERVAAALAHVDALVAGDWGLSPPPGPARAG